MADAPATTPTPDEGPDPAVAAFRAARPGLYGHVDDATLKRLLIEKGKYEEFLPKPPPGTVPEQQPRYVNLDPLQLSRFPAVRERLGNVAEGAKEAIQAIPQAAGAVGEAALGAAELIGAPFGLTEPTRAKAAIAAVQEDPSMIARGIKGIVPMSQTLTGLAQTVASGDPSQLPSERTVEKELGGWGATEMFGAGVSAIAKPAYKAVMTRLPGSAVVKHAEAVPELRAIAENLRPGPQAVQTAYDRLDSMRLLVPNPNVDMTHLVDRIDELVKRETAGTGTRSVGGADPDWLVRLKHLREEVEDPATGARAPWNFDKVRAFHESLGDEMSTPRQPMAGSPGSRQAISRDKELRALMRAINDDARRDQPILTDQWRQARDLAHKEKSSVELGAEINKAIGTSGNAYTTVSRVNALIAKIKQLRAGAGGWGDKAARRWVQGFTDPELDGIVSKLEQVQRQLPAIPTQRGRAAGSMVVGSRALISAGIGELLGVHPVIAAGTTEAGFRLLQKASMSEAGQAVVRHALRMDPTRGPFFRHIVAGYLRQQEASQEETRREYQRGAAAKELGSLVDQWRRADQEQRIYLRPVLMSKLMAGGLDPAKRDQLLQELRPNSLPEVAPVH